VLSRGGLLPGVGLADGLPLPPRSSVTGALELVPVPGLGAGNLDREGNVAAWLDRLVLGPHIWRVGRVYDPEGILSTVPAIATTLFGVLAGRLVRSGLGTADTATGLVGGAVESARPRGSRGCRQQGAVTGLVWCSAGAAWMALAVGYRLIEVRRRGGRPSGSLRPVFFLDAPRSC
jgi:predicted acyltransferase